MIPTSNRKGVVEQHIIPSLVAFPLPRNSWPELKKSFFIWFCSQTEMSGWRQSEYRQKATLRTLFGPN